MNAIDTPCPLPPDRQRSHRIDKSGGLGGSDLAIRTEHGDEIRRPWWFGFGNPNRAWG